MWVPLLLAAWAAAIVTCVRLCRVSMAAAEAPEEPEGAASGPLTLYEAAYLAGGPHRVADLALVAMARQRRLLLAHTGWATVLDPVGRDEVERSLITVIGGPGGQSPIPAVRAALAAADAVRALAERLAAAGLAVPEAVRAAITTATRQVRAASVLVLAAGTVAELLAGTVASGTGAAHAGERESVAPWFVLPLLLTLGALAIARVEVHPYTRWASSAGACRLREIAHAAGAAEGPGAGSDGDPTTLTTLALKGPSALAEPSLRAALGGARSPLRGH
ncbi:TIGR04222 domain-containing membrane protein [Streptomyces sp. NPDC054796]